MYDYELLRKYKNQKNSFCNHIFGDREGYGRSVGGQVGCKTFRITETVFAPIIIIVDSRFSIFRFENKPCRKPVEAANKLELYSSETSIFFRTTWCYNTEDRIFNSNY